MNWYIKVLKNYAVFTGRARRKEYWFFILINFLISLGLTLIDLAIGTFNQSTEVGLFSGLYSLAVFIPGLAVSVRRLHDIDKSGWWILINAVPLIGFIVYLFFMVKEGTPGPNRFGPDPKEDI